MLRFDAASAIGLQHERAQIALQPPPHATQRARSGPQRDTPSLLDRRG